MRLRESPRRTVRRWIVGDAVGSRWWYWIAAIPVTFAFWTVTVVWVAVAIGVGPLSDPNPVDRAAEISLVAFGVPFLALAAISPFAVYADASAVLSAAVDWTPPRQSLTAAAAIGPLTAVALGVVDWAAGGSPNSRSWLLVLAFLLSVPVATYYLYLRHDHLGVP